MAGAATRRAAPPMLLLLLTLAALAPAHGGRTTGPRGSLLGSPHGVDERAEQAACANACDIMKLPDPKSPATSSTDTGKAVAQMFRGIFEVMKAFDQIPYFKKVGAIGTALIFGIEGFDAKKNPEYQTYKMQKDLKQSTDYLACKMDAMVRDLNIAADKRMSDQDLNDFNTGLKGVIDEYTQHCGAMNCLSVAHLPPSQRNQNNMDCAFDEGLSPQCPKTTSFNESSTCTYVKSGQTLQGQCDPNGRCYDVYEYPKAVAEMREVVKLFAKKDNLDNFNRLEKSTDTKSILAVAKGSLLKILMLQQLIMLDGTGGDNGALTAFADEMANKLQVRYDQMVDVERLIGVVSALSTPSLAFNDFRPDVVVWPRQRGSRCWSLRPSLGTCTYEYLMGTNDAITIKAQVRKSCQAAAKVVETKCFIRPYMTTCGYWDGSCSEYKKNTCYGAWDRCVNDVNQPSWTSTFVGPYADLLRGQGKLNQERCPGVVTVVKKAVREQAVSLQADIIKELADVKDIIATLRGIKSSGGMPQSSFGILRKEYPRYTGACSSTAPRPALAASSQAATCGRNCASCQPSWRCLKCKPGFRMDASGSTCSK